MGNTASKAPFDYEVQLADDTVQQSRESKTPDESKDSGVPRVTLEVDQLCDKAFPDEGDGVQTIWECFQRGVSKFPTSNLFGTRGYVADEAKEGYKAGPHGFPLRSAYTWQTYKAVEKIALEFGSGLQLLGAKPEDNIGLFSINRAEWMIAALGIWSFNARVCSLYATLGEDAVEYIVNHAETGIVCTSKKNLPILLADMKKLKCVKVIVQWDSNEIYGNILDTVSEEDVKKAAEFDVKLVGFSEVVKMGHENPQKTILPTRDDLAFIMYTSGTTGVPKGAMLAHGNVASNVAGLAVMFPLNEKDVHFSFLPLAHIFETLVQAVSMSYGGSVAFYQGEIKMLTADLCAARPTIFCGVPRVFQKIYQKIFGVFEEKNCLVRAYFNKGYSHQCEMARTGQPFDKDYEKKLFVPIRTKVGLDRCRAIITGAAPCPPYLMEFLRVAVGATVMQGYGLTETGAACAFSAATDRNNGHVGVPYPTNEIKLVDIPEMQYLHTDNPPRGEICVRGANVFKGYFKNEEATAEALVDGWLHTGDVGRWNPNGTLSIIDRKKNIFKLANGEYIAAEKIELIYSKCSLVGQIWVYGNSYKNFVVAIVVPNPDNLLVLAKEKKWWTGSSDDVANGSEEFIANFQKTLTGPNAPQIKKAIFAGLKSFNSSLKRFEWAKDIIIESSIDDTMCGFTEGNNCMTPTFKLRRPNLLKRYVKVLKEAYAANGEAPEASEKWGGEDG